MSQIYQSIILVLFLAVCTVAISAEPPTTQAPRPTAESMKKAPVFTCQSQIVIKGPAFTLNEQLTPFPYGWNVVIWNRNSIPLKPVRHWVGRDSMMCAYATNTHQEALNVIQLWRPFPKGMTCKKMSGFRFRCSK